ncbi:hypothetical protein AB1Y20_020408 [Prymnesium parvum]|uniref:Uncharacterized protein n=1 Tax=Prymnesium parvum TaxID=97485 RepID=A0AB34JX16_PRYPA
MAWLEKAAGLYVTLILALTLRVLLNESAAPPPPPPPPVTCSWQRFGCSPGCVFRGKCVPRKPAPPPPPKELSVSRADSLMKHRSIPHCLAAADIYEAAAAAAPSAAAAAPLRLRAAEALVCAMRRHTNGNLMVVEGTQDTPAFKQYWATHGPRALSNVRAAKAHLPPGFALAATEMDAFLYANSAKGIVRQALTGAGNEYMRLAHVLASTYESYEGGVGHCYLGGFFAVAPWPLGNAHRALAEMKAALQIEPNSRRNNYYVCLLLYQAGEKDAAAKQCQAALKASCLGSEHDYCDFLTSQVELVLALSRS